MRILASKVSNFIGSIPFTYFVGTEWGLSIFDGERWQSYQMHNSELADNDINAIVVLRAGPSLPARLDKATSATGSLSGQIVDNNEPVPNATVELCVESIGIIGLALSDDVPGADQPFILYSHRHHRQSG
jgi:hypothetical protein